MNHSEYEKLSGIIRTLLNIAPFVGGSLAQAWEERDSYKTNRALERALLLPRVEQRIVRVKPSLWSIDRIRRLMKADRLEGDLYFLRNPVSTPLFHVEHLVRIGRLDLRRISDRPRQPHESVEILENGGPSTHLVLWSPHWQIYERLGIGESIPQLNYYFRGGRGRSKLLPCFLDRSA